MFAMSTCPAEARAFLPLKDKKRRPSIRAARDKM